MMRDNLVETLVGAAIIALSIIFIVYGYNTIERGGGGSGYEIIADFDSVSGLTIGSDVRLAGIKIGSVSKLSLDAELYRARVILSVQDGVMIPEDSSAKITSDGLLGNNYVSLTAGGSEEMLLAGDTLIFTQGSVDLIGLVGQALFSAGDSTKDADGGQGDAGGSSAIK